MYWRHAPRFLKIKSDTWCSAHSGKQKKIAQILLLWSNHRHDQLQGKPNFTVQHEANWVHLRYTKTRPIWSWLCSKASVYSTKYLRVLLFFYVTYDYTASNNITARYQDMGHPVCDFAHNFMKVALGGTGIWLSDGADESGRNEQTYFMRYTIPLFSESNMWRKGKRERKRVTNACVSGNN